MGSLNRFSWAVKPPGHWAHCCSGNAKGYNPQRMALPEPKARLQRLFDRLAAPYARFVFSRLRHETRGDVAWVQPRAGERVLDLACGPGTLALELAQYGCRVYALDLAEQMILRAHRIARRQRCPPVHFAVADAEQLPVADETFDLVTCAFSIAVFPAPPQAAAEMFRVARPGGRIAVLEAVAPEDPAQSAELARLERLRSAGAPARLVSLPELLALFRRAGLELLDASVSERRRRLEDWLSGAAVRGGAAARQRLRRQLLETAKRDAAGLRLERHRGRWFYCAKVARLLWVKQP